LVLINAIGKKFTPIQELINLLQFPNIIDIFFKDLILALGGFWCFARALLSMLSSFGILLGLLWTFMGSQTRGMEKAIKY